MYAAMENKALEAYSELTGMPKIGDSGKVAALRDENNSKFAGIPKIGDSGKAAALRDESKHKWRGVGGGRE